VSERERERERKDNDDNHNNNTVKLVTCKLHGQADVWEERVWLDI
jgi:hypothetical protein